MGTSETPPNSRAECSIRPHGGTWGETTASLNSEHASDHVPDTLEGAPFGDVCVENENLTQTRSVLRQAEQHYRSLLESIDGIVWQLDYATWRFTFVSKQAERLLGYSVERWLNEPTFWVDHLHPADCDQTVEKCTRLSERNENHELEYRMIRADGGVVWFHDVVTVEQRDGRPFRLRGVMLDITERKQEEALRAGENKILEMIATSVAIDLVLNEISLLIESHSPGTCCAVLLLDRDGIHVSRAVAPHLSDSYKAAVQGVAIGPREGSCGAAMYWKRPIVVDDIGTDPLWDNYRELAIAHGVRACWSTPILTAQGKVLGTFGMHSRERRKPNAAEVRLAEVASRLACIAIEREIMQESLRQSAAALRESEERSQAMLRALPDLMFLLSEDGVYLDCHAPNDADLVLPREELLGRNISEVLPSKLADTVRKAFCKASESGQLQTIEYDLVVGGKLQRHEARVICCSNGRFLALVRDISERKAAEAALRLSEERFRMLSAATRDAVYDCDLHRNLAWRNESYRALYAPDSPANSGHDWWRERIHPHDRPRVARELDSAFRSRQRFWSGEYSFRRPDGTYANVMDRGYILYDSDGEPARIIGAMTDITAYRESERALRASEERYRNVVETQTEMICRFLPDTTLTFVNDAYCRHFSKTRDELIGKSFLELVPPSERALLRERVNSVLAGRPSGPERNATLQSDGSIRWTEWSNYVLRDRHGEVELQAIGRDITEQKLAEEALRKSDDELRRSHAEIRNLARKLMYAQEEERRHIARELHDDVNSSSRLSPFA